MSKYRLTIAYDGTGYAGWQVQPNGLTIQEVLQDCLARILQHPITVTGAGRTDAGVHARGQVAHFLTDKDIDSHRLAHSLNALLPPNIRIVALAHTDPDFHARYSTKKKCYHYTVCTAEVPNPCLRLYQWHYPYSLDLPRMQGAARVLIGTHDFTSFANAPTQGAVSRNPIRTIDRIDLVKEPGILRFELEGQSFLYKMVRNIVGTLIEIGSGKPHDISAILTSCDRSEAGQAAPPHGLFLEWIRYE